ncbi:MAG: TetR/AcrR family transcriptional regulator [Deltaproteobacteria bacterium]|nr:TetR/AcrR family transcriptional regulator [Deltaproteobacteria bacterium]
MPDTAPRERILDAALRLFGRDGASAAPLRQIGAEAGLHNSSLFHHFRGKGAIHDALAERVIDAAAAHVATLAEEASPRLETLSRALGDLAEHLAGRPDEANFLASTLLSGNDSALAGARARAETALLEPLWKWIVRARDAGEIRSVRPQAATLQIMGLVLLEPAWGQPPGATGMRPAARARRRELDAWLRGSLTK